MVPDHIRQNSWISSRQKHFTLLIIYQKIIHIHINWIPVFNRQCLSACYAHGP